MNNDLNSIACYYNTIIKTMGIIINNWAKIYSFNIGNILCFTNKSVSQCL